MKGILLHKEINKINKYSQFIRLVFAFVYVFKLLSTTRETPRFTRPITPQFLFLT